MRRRALIGLASLSLTACAAMEAEPPAGAIVLASEAPEWIRLSDPADVDRLRRLPDAWAAALAGAARAGARRRIAAEGPLLDPDSALTRPTPPPGAYRCRLLRVGGGGRGGLESNPPHFCHVEDADGVLAFTKAEGSERPGGYLHPDEDERRLVFLGAVARVGDSGPPAYGHERGRDRIGVLERIGAFRWRLVIAPPAAGARLEVLELVPALP